MGTPAAIPDPHRLLAPHWSANFVEVGHLSDKLRKNGQVVLLDGEHDELHARLLEHFSNMEDCSFHSISRSAVFAKFREDFRKAIVLHTELNRKVYEGVVIEYEGEIETTNIVGRCIRFFRKGTKIQLRTAEETKMLHFRQFDNDEGVKVKIMTTTKGGTVQKRGFAFEKKDFLPEKSFRNWTNYLADLGSSTEPHLV